MAPKFHHIIQIIPHPTEPNFVLGLDKDGDIHVGQQRIDERPDGGLVREFEWTHVPSHWTQPDR